MISSEVDHCLAGEGKNQTRTQISSHSLFQSMLRSRLCEQQPKITGWKTQNYFAAHHVLFSSDRYRDSRGTWETIGLFITTESKDALTDPLGLNYHLPQDAISQRTDLNVSGRAAHAAVGLSVPPQTTKKISDFTAVSLQPFSRL